MIFSLGLTLLILVFTFGAFVAAGIPRAARRSPRVLATLGLLGPVSQLAPVDESVMRRRSCSIGMAVGVDYSLFYLQAGARGACRRT